VPHPLRILIGADTFPPDVNGAAHFARDHAIRLARRGHEVHVLAPATGTRTSSGTEWFDGTPVRVHRLRSVRWPLHDWLRVTPPWEVRHQVQRVLDLVDPEVVHVQSFLNIGRGLTVQADVTGIPIVATNHVMAENLVEFSGVPEFLHPRLSRFVWGLASRTYARAAVVTSPTPIAARYLEIRTGLPSVHAVSCGIDLPRFRPKTHKPTRPRVLYTGRLSPEKNVGTLVRAFALLSVGTAAVLDIVGSGTERATLERMAVDLGVAERVVFHGRVSSAELVRLHHEATVFVMPSAAELQSIATLEALASGTPVVVADAMALPHLVDDGVEGYRVAPRDARGFADSIQRILDLTARQYQPLSTAALARAREHDSATVVEHFERLYHDVSHVRTLVAA
jgi:glycosyltransferase involved in cell wall biosynthesis